MSTTQRHFATLLAIPLLLTAVFEVLPRSPLQTVRDGFAFAIWVCAYLLLCVVLQATTDLAGRRFGARWTGIGFAVVGLGLAVGFVTGRLGELDWMFPHCLISRPRFGGLALIAVPFAIAILLKGQTLPRQTPRTVSRED